MTNGIFTVPVPRNEPIKDYVQGSPERRDLRVELGRLKSTATSVPQVIGGEHIYSEQKAPLSCPHNHKLVIGEHGIASGEQIRKSIKIGVETQKSWSAMPWWDRAAIFLKAADLLAGPYRALMNAATMLGQSKTVFQAEIDAACELADFWRFNARFMADIYQDQPLSPPGFWNRLDYRGLEGFVFAVSPFNFTSIALNLASAPAMMGCAVLWKPAHTSLLSSWVGLKILEEAGLPPGVIQMVAGEAAEIGKIALESPDLAGIHFTGSTATFNLLWQQVGQRVSTYKTYPRLVGETGGKDFIMAHSSADPAALITALVRGAFEYQGQKCSAASRAYIPRTLWKRIREPLVAMVQAIKCGDPEDFSNFMGAVIDEKSFDRISGWIERSRVDPKAQIIAGGECNREQGWFIRPTLIEALVPDFATMKEELFGPVLTIFVYEDSDFESALKYCEQTSPYGLTGAIFAQDRRVIQKMSTALEYAAGNFYINDKPTGAVVGQQPFGGGRASGTNDKAGSRMNLQRWVSGRTIKETFVAPKSYEYPYMAGNPLS